jgi:hypothetical protein
MLRSGRINYTASDFLPSVLKDAGLKPNHGPTRTAFQQAVGTDLSIFEWMHQLVPSSDTDWRPGHARKHSEDEGVNGLACEIRNPTPRTSKELVPRPEEELFQLGMAGLGRGTGQYHAQDFPWKRLGSGTVVDVGGGIGMSHIEISFVRSALY